MSLLGATDVTLGVLAVFTILTRCLSLARRHASVVDPFWGVGFIVAAVSCLLLTRLLVARSRFPQGGAIHGMFPPADWRRMVQTHQPRCEAGCDTRQSVGRLCLSLGANTTADAEGRRENGGRNRRPY